MKKIISVLAVITIVLSLCACGAQASNPPGTSAPADLSGEITGEITVNCYDGMRYKNYLDAAAALFEEKYPGTKVTVTSFAPPPEVRTVDEGNGQRMQMAMSTDTPEQRSDYVTKTNTQLMSGEGADIIAADVLPWYKYAGNGQLAELGSYMEADPGFNSADYQQNVFEATKYKGGQYILPMDYTFEALAYDGSLFTDEQKAVIAQDNTFDYEKLVEIAKDSFEAKNADDSTKMFPIYDGAAGMGRTMFAALAELNYSQFIDVENKKVNLNDGKFAALLETAKEYGEKGYLNPSVSAADRQNPEDMRKMFESNQSTKYFWKTVQSTQLLRYFYQDTSRGRRVNMGYVTTAGVAGGNSTSDDDVFAGMLSGQNGEIPLSFSQAYAMNANSSNKATAWAFLKFLIGEEAQVSMSISGMPVNNNARMEKAKGEITGDLYAVMFNDQNGGAAAPERKEASELTEEQKQVLDQYMKAVDEYSARLNTYILQDQTISDMINAEVQAFFDGTKTADETAKTLQNKVELYINE